jgi:uncharacterized membrane protein
MMGLRWYWIAAWGLVLISAIASALALAWLPDRIPTHWNFQGEVDGHGPKWTVLLFPATMIFLVGLFSAMPWLSPRGFEIDLSLKVYLQLMLILAGLFTFINVMILYGSFTGVLVGRLMIGGICVFLGLVGNLLGKVDRNFFIGVRTPWTLASERVWIETHRLAAWLAVAGSIVSVVLLLLCIPPIPVWVAFVVIMASFVYPALHSLILYKRFQSQGTLDMQPQNNG